MIDKESKIVVIKCGKCGKEYSVNKSYNWRASECSCGGREFEEVKKVEVITK